MTFRNWSTVRDVVAAEAMIDRVVLICDGAFRFDAPVTVTEVSEALTTARTAFGQRVRSDVRWRRISGRLDQLELVSGRSGAEWLIGVRLKLSEPTLRDPLVVGVRATCDVNPTRVRRSLGQSTPPDWWSAACGPRSANFTAAAATRGNEIPEELLVNPGARFLWISDAGQILNGVISRLSYALFAPGIPPRYTRGGTGSFHHVFFRQIECYWDFRSPTPEIHVRRFLEGVRAGGAAGRRMWNEYEQDGSLVAQVPLIARSSDQTGAVPTAALYARLGRVRLEVRYGGDIARQVPGAGSAGGLTDRLACIAENAANRLNRLMGHTFAYRQQNHQQRRAPAADLLLGIAQKVGRDRAVDVATRLLNYGNVRAGATGDISINEARRMVRIGLIARRPSRARDIGGTVYGLGPMYQWLAEHQD